jgi:hypothetical protein
VEAYICLLKITIKRLWDLKVCNDGIVTCSLKATIVEPEETAVAREWPVNTFPWQQIQERNNRGIVVGGVFYPACERSNIRLMKGKLFLQKA